MNLSIKEQLVYAPARDFDRSKRFYGALGFEITEPVVGHADCRLGRAAFRLQDRYNKDWADNFMMLFSVNRLDRWIERVRTVIDPGDYLDARSYEPETPNGKRMFHVHDPSGGLLIFID